MFLSYLLSPRTSSLGGVGIPSVRIVLVGCESPSTLRNFNKDLDVTIFSEIVEFALSLSPPKGQDTFGGLPHLQAYKLIRASHLAEMGHVEIANRYVLCLMFFDCYFDLDEIAIVKLSAAPFGLLLGVRSSIRLHSSEN